MALLFMDSFDSYATADIGKKGWALPGNTVNIQTTAGRRSSQCMRGTNSTAYAQRSLLVSPTTVILGFAYKFLGGLGNFNMLSLGEAAGTHINLKAQADGSLLVQRASAGGWSPAGTTIAQSSPGIITSAVYFQVQLKVTVHDTTGYVEVRLNGNPTPVCTFTGDTRNAGTGIINIIMIGSDTSGGGGCDFDDFWICDDTGPAPQNNFLGDCRADVAAVQAASANGAPNTQWTPTGAANNFQCVDEALSNSDTDYNSATAVNLLDTFVVADVPVAGAAVYGVQFTLMTKKAEAGLCSIAPAVRSGGADHVVSPAMFPSTDYQYLTKMLNTAPPWTGGDPTTGSAWSEAGFNGSEFGYKRIT